MAPDLRPVPGHPGRHLPLTLGTIDALWTPDGRQIVVGTGRIGEFSELGIMDPDGSNFRPLVVNGFPDDRAEGFHQDGFQSDESGNFEVWKMNADGTGRVQLTDFGASLPDWSPDGTRIAFNGGRTGDFEIYTMDPFGNNIVQVTHLSGQDSGPKWSPDGSRLAWQRSVAPGNFEIFTARADGGVRRAGNDRVVGDAGTDLLSAGPGDDRIAADPDERIDRGAGTDLCAVGPAVVACPPRLS